MACRAAARAFTKSGMHTLTLSDVTRSRGGRGIISKQRRLLGFSYRLYRMLRIRTCQGEILGHDDNFRFGLLGCVFLSRSIVVR